MSTGSRRARAERVARDLVGEPNPARLADALVDFAEEERMRVTKTIELTAAERELMRVRCEEDGHVWENACSVMLRVYQVCKWCGTRR